MSNTAVLDRPTDEEEITHATFSITSQPLTKAGGAEGGAKVVRATASSTEIDLEGDRFTEKALEEMRAGFIGLTIFLNHKYDVPESVFGTVESAVLTKREGYVDLDMDIVVQELNERALQIYQMIETGTKFGVSVGVMVDNAEKTEEQHRAGRSVVEIDSTTPLEASIVGIPANRRSWVKDAIAGMIEAGMLEVDVKYVGDRPWLIKSLSKSRSATVRDLYKEASSMTKKTKDELADEEEATNDGTSPAADDEETDDTPPADDDEDEDEDEETDDTPPADDEEEGTKSVTPQLTLDVFLNEMAEQDFFSAFYRATWALSDALNDLLSDDDVADRSAAANEALESFHKFIAGRFDTAIASMAGGESQGEAIGLAVRAAMEGLTQKLGNRNNKTDQKNLQSIHDLCLDLGASCKEKAADDKGDEEDDDYKSLQAQVEALHTKADTLLAQREEAQTSEKRSRTIVEQLLELPLPRKAVVGGVPVDTAELVKSLPFYDKSIAKRLQKSLSKEEE